MTFVAIAIAAVVCGWSVLLVICDERQRALSSAQSTGGDAICNCPLESKKSDRLGKKKELTVFPDPS